MKAKLNITIKIISAAIIWFWLFFYGDFSNEINNSTERLFKILKGEATPDSSIVIIHISQDDIDKIGPWPIKRSYYALLINNLTKQNVKKIGLEIFLSSRLVTQSIYEDLLKNEIIKSGKVVLSSVAGVIYETDNVFATDSLSFPSTKLLSDEIETGHINFINENGFKIPLKIVNQNTTEDAFAIKISNAKVDKNYILVNFISSWQKFRNYSLTEYFNLLQTQPQSLNFLKDKIVIIGISDAQIAKTFTSAFDDELPGTALHAFAIDNILNSRYLCDNNFHLSIFIFIVIILLLIFLSKRNNQRSFLIYAAALIIFFIISFYIYIYLHNKLALSYFLIPLLFLITYDFIQSLLKSRTQLKNVIDESDLLKSILAKKEHELNLLQNEFDAAGSNSNQLMLKIKILKNEIERIKENETDNLPSTQVFGNDVQNFFGIVYVSNLMHRSAELIKKAAPTDSTILITGESGTGKELAANAIHKLSSRIDNKFIAVNCRALSENLLESELFGHERGAFTGAVSNKLGKFEQADKGTIFLDEIGETSENFQVKLLRVLQSGDIEKIGSTISNKVDVRVIAATNIDLKKAVREKIFREDLYYRLNVFEIELPPLRKRKEDIEPLATHFLKMNEGDIKISKAVQTALIEYEWKGNVRELESVIKRAVIFAKSANRKLIQISDLPEEIVKVSKYNFEDLVLDSLRSKNYSHSSITETAKELGNVNRTLISENFRGVVLRTLSETNFQLDAVVNHISLEADEDIKQKVRSKIETIIENIENDISKLNNISFEEAKKIFSAKYKNLPVKFHPYLDELIKFKLRESKKQ